MELPTIEALSERLDRLERENTALKRLGAGLVVGLVLILGLGTGLFRVPKEVSAHRFVLQDESGATRALLALNRDGSPSLRLLTRDSRDQAVLEADRNGTSSLRYYEGPMARLAVVSGPKLGSSIDLFHRPTGSRSGLFLKSDGSSGLRLGRDRREVAMGLNPDGSARLKFADVKGRERGGIALDKEGMLTYLEAQDVPSVETPEADEPSRSDRLEGPPASRRFHDPKARLGIRSFSTP